MKETSRPDGFDLTTHAMRYLADTYPGACDVNAGYLDHPEKPHRDAIRILEACRTLSWMGKNEDTA